MTHLNRREKEICGQKKNLQVTIVPSTIYGHHPKVANMDRDSVMESQAKSWSGAFCLGHQPCTQRCGHSVLTSTQQAQHGGSSILCRAVEQRQEKHSRSPENRRAYSQTTSALAWAQSVKFTIPLPTHSYLLPYRLNIRLVPAARHAPGC